MSSDIIKIIKKFFIICFLIINYPLISYGISNNTSTANQKLKLDKKKVNEIYYAILEGNENKRYEAIKEIIEKYNIPKIVDKFIKLQLSKDKSILVQELILDYIKKNTSTNDFAYIINYLKVSSNFELSQYAIKILYDLEPYQLRSELEKLFDIPYTRLHLFNFLVILQTPLKVDIDWIAHIVKKFNLWYDYINLPIDFEKKLIKKLLPYYIFFEMSCKDIFECYYYLQFESLTSKYIPEFSISNIPLKSLSLLTNKKIKIFLDLLVEYIPIPVEDLYKIDNIFVYEWLLDKHKKSLDGSFKKKYRIKNLSNFPNHIIYSKKIVTYKIFLSLYYQNVKDVRIQQTILNYCLDLLSQNKISVQKNYEINKEELCFFIILKYKKQRKYLLTINLFLEKISLEYKKFILNKYLPLWINTPELITIPNIKLMLMNKNSDSRFKILYYIDPKYLEKYKVLFQIYYQKEKNQFLKYFFKIKLAL